MFCSARAPCNVPKNGWWYTRLCKGISEPQGAQWSGAVGLDNDCVACGDGWTHLVRDEVQRVIEWCYRGNDAERLAEPVAHAAFAAPPLVKSHGFAPHGSAR